MTKGEANAEEEQVKSSSEVKEDTSKSEKWPFSEPQPIREDQVRNAVNFLSHPKVRGTPMVQRFSFLERKGLTRQEIDEAFRRCPDPPTSEATKTVGLLEGKLVTSPSTQAPSPSTHPTVVSPQPQGPSSVIVPPHSGSHWSQLILGAGLIAAAGVGTGYLFQKVLTPKLRGWLRDLVLDEKKSKGSEGEVQEKSLKLSPLEEAVSAAATAANAASAAVAEVANMSQEVLKQQAEEWKNLRSLIKSLDNKTDELQSTLTTMSKNSQGAHGQMVLAHTEESIGANSYQGAYQRTMTPAEHVQMKQDILMSRSMAMGNGRTQSNGHDAIFNNYVSHTEEEPWWCRKKTEVETFTLPRKNVESTTSEADAELDEPIGSAGSRAIEFGVQSRGGPLGRQGWMPPPAPQIVMPGAASAIRYQKPATVNEVGPSIISEEKTVDSQTSFEQRSLPLLPLTGRPGSPSTMRIQNPEETKPSVVAEEKEMDTQTFFELPKMPQVTEITEITSVDKDLFTGWNG